MTTVDPHGPSTHSPPRVVTVTSGPAAGSKDATAAGGRIRNGLRRPLPRNGASVRRAVHRVGGVADDDPPPREGGCAPGTGERATVGVQTSVCFPGKLKFALLSSFMIHFRKL